MTCGRRSGTARRARDGSVHEGGNIGMSQLKSLATPSSCEGLNLQTNLKHGRNIAISKVLDC